jgi:hypothetical protein
MHIGFTRMIYPFFCSITFPSGKLIQVKMLFGIVYYYYIKLAMPRSGESECFLMNGVYDCSCYFVFPSTIFLGSKRRDNK